MVTGEKRRVFVMTLQEQIQNALNQDVELSEEEYKAKTAQADSATAKHGVKGRAAVTEATRYRRISMNYYGTALNFMAGILTALDYNNALLAELVQAQKPKEEEKEVGNGRGTADGNNE